MAIPPTGFTQLLYQEKTPNEIYERLKRENCLSATGLQNKQRVVSLISETLTASRERLEQLPIICGGGPIDDLAGALLRSEYVSRTAIRLHQPHLYKAENEKKWWKFWA